MAKLSQYTPALKPTGKIAFDAGGDGTTSAPSYIKLVSANGTPRYIFVENDGTVKVHTAVPTANTDGSEVGAQS